MKQSIIAHTLGEEYFEWNKAMSCPRNRILLLTSESSIISSNFIKLLNLCRQVFVRNI